MNHIMTERMRQTLILLTLALTVCLFPAASPGNSIYALNFFGERLETGDGRAVGLGGDIQLLPDSLAILHHNPAMLIYLGKVTIGTGQVFMSDKSKGMDFSQRKVTFKFPAFRLAFPLTKKVVVAVGYQGRYDPDGTIAFDSERIDGETYVNTFNKSGGLYSVPLTIAVKLSKYAGAGAYVSLERGSINDQWTIDFKNRALATGTGRREVGISGTGYGGGMVLFPDGPVILGAHYEGKITYDADVRERYTQTALDTIYRTEITLPSAMGVGLTWKIAKNWLFATSAEWRDFEGSSTLGFPPERTFKEERYAVGLEYAKGFRFILRFPLRIAFSYERLPYDFPEGERIDKYLFTFGTGLIFRGGKGKLDIAFQGGKTGAIDNNGLQDRIFRIYIGISGQEAWKRERQDR